MPMIRPVASGQAAVVLLGVLLAAALLSGTTALVLSPSAITIQRRHEQHRWSLPSHRGASITTRFSSRSAPAHLLLLERPYSKQAFGTRNLNRLASSSSSVAASESSGSKGEVSEPSALPPLEIHQVQQHRANATTLTVESSSPDDDAPQPAEPAITEAAKKLPFPLVLWKFSRPHTLIGSAIAIPALHFLAAPTLSAAFTSKTAASILYAMLPSLLMNVYITGLNQISDVEIDRINKPYLVLPAGIMSRSSAIVTVIVCLVLSLGLGQVPTPWSTEGLNVALWGSAILGTMYSVEPFRLKRSPLLAALCIVAVRGTIINASFFAHATAAAFGGVSGGSGSVLRAILTDRKCLLSSLFYCVFGVVIALMKDVPDVRGDLSSRVRTFSVRLGQDRVFHWTRRLLTGLFWAYGAGLMRSAIVTAVRSSAVPLECALRGIAAVAAFWAGQSVRRQSRGVDPNDPGQVYEYYMHLWKLFYGSYLALPFAR
jgi:homogentisate phytyltransferase / homogentisate geranylgeranyltransferase